jgi:hypothetical protein
VKFGVVAIELHKLFMVTDFYDLPSVHDYDAVTLAHGGEAMGDDEYSSTFTD